MRVILDTGVINCQVNGEKDTIAHAVQCFEIAGVRSGKAVLPALSGMSIEKH